MFYLGFTSSHLASFKLPNRISPRNSPKSCIINSWHFPNSFNELVSHNLQPLDRSHNLDLVINWSWSQKLAIVIIGLNLAIFINCHILILSLKLSLWNLQIHFSSNKTCIESPIVYSFLLRLKLGFIGLKHYWHPAKVSVHFLNAHSPCPSTALSISL